MSLLPPKARNIISSYGRQLVSAVVGLMATRLLIRKLGLDTYGGVYFLLQLGALVDIFGNTLTGATARFTTQTVAQGETQKASGYLSNTLVSLLGFGLVALIVFNTFAYFSASPVQNIPLALLNLVVIALVMTSMSNALAVGNFLREEFVSRAGVQIAANLLYLGVLFGMLMFSDFGVWAVGWANLASATLALVAFYYLCRKLAPELKLSLRLISWSQILELGKFVGWMLLTYCAIYITRSGTLMAVQRFGTPAELGRFALFFQVSLLVLTALQTFSLVTAPAIYRCLAIGNNTEATAHLESFLFETTLFGSFAVLGLWLEGENILQLWLGAAAPHGMSVLLASAGLLAITMGWSTGLSVYLAGYGHVRNYGIVAVSVSLAVVGAAFYLMATGRNSMTQCVIPLIVGEIGKCLLITQVIDRPAFAFSRLGRYFKKSAVILGLIAVAALLWWCLHKMASPNNWPVVVLRSVVFALPLAGYFLSLAKSKPIRSTRGKAT